MKYIQSFYPYPVTFSAIEKTIPARAAQGELRNLAEVTDEELEKLQKCEPFFRELVNKKKYRVLNKMPEGYKPAAQQINEARAEAEALRARVAELEAAKGNTEPAQAQEEKPEEIPLDQYSYKDLQAMAQGMNLEYKNVKKSDLIKAIEAARE